MHHDLRVAADDLFPSIQADLEDLIRIPSISAPAYGSEGVARAAEATAELLRRAGFDGVSLLRIPGAHPAVYGEIPAPPGAPTVLLYAHTDVQPAGDEAEWEAGAFEPCERDGRLYGRGSSDNKCGIVLHTGVARMFSGRPPVGLKVFIEGEEEVGSAHFGAYLDEYSHLLGADVIVVPDSMNWAVGRPAITTSLRGLIGAEVEVRVLDTGVHSGLAGGPIPDALSILTRLLADLHDDEGRVAVPGLAGFESDPLGFTEDDLRRQYPIRPSVRLIGEGSLTSRLWTRPAISVLAVDAPRVDQAINQLVPVARAKVSLRTAPGQDTAAAAKALRDHLLAADAWGAEVTVDVVERADAFRADISDPRVGVFRTALAEAWGVDPIEIGVGGSIPIVADLQRVLPEAAIVLTGIMDPASAAHGPNESVDLGDLRRAMLAEAIALRLLAG